MRLYLSSYRFGNNPEQILKLTTGKRAAVIVNAMDGVSDKERAEIVQTDMESLQRLGFTPEEIDLRDYFGKRLELTAKMTNFDFVWVHGGNVFVLRRAFKMSGADWVLTDMIREDQIAYGGFDAGICVLQRDLRGLEHVDDAVEVPEGYILEPLWEGLKIFRYSFAPHYKSSDPKSAAMEKVIAAYSANATRYVTLGDGEVLVINGNEEFVDF